MLIKNSNKIDFVQSGGNICFQLQVDCIETNKINRRLYDYETVVSQTIMKLALSIAYCERDNEYDSWHYGSTTHQLFSGGD